MIAAPSHNGNNGQARKPRDAEPTPSINGDNERDERGRFAKGNRGGPGNPFARRVARLRQVMLDAVTEEDLQAIVRDLVRQARQGDLAASKLVLHYAVGKPVATVEPDSLDVEELELYRRGTQTEQMMEIVQALPAELMCELARILLPCQTKSFLKILLGGVDLMEESQAAAGEAMKRAAKSEGNEAEKQEARESGAEGTGASPSSTQSVEQPASREAARVKGTAGGHGLGTVLAGGINSTYMAAMKEALKKILGPGAALDHALQRLQQGAMAHGGKTQKGSLEGVPGGEDVQSGGEGHEEEGRTARAG